MEVQCSMLDMGMIQIQNARVISHLSLINVLRDIVHIDFRWIGQLSIANCRTSSYVYRRRGCVCYSYSQWRPMSRNARCKLVFAVALGTLFHACGLFYVYTIRLRVHMTSSCAPKPFNTTVPLLAAFSAFIPTRTAPECIVEKRQA